MASRSLFLDKIKFKVKDPLNFSTERDFFDTSNYFRYKHLSLRVPNVEFDVSALIRQNLTSKLKI